MNEFKIEVPINAKKESSGNNGPGVSKIGKGVVAGNIATKALTAVMGGLMKVIEPLTKMLSVLFMIIFMPLMPIVKLLAKFMGEVAKGLAKFMKGEVSMQELVDEYLKPAFTDLMDGLKEWWKETGKPLMDEIMEGLKEWWEETGKPLLNEAFSKIGKTLEKLTPNIIKGLLKLIWNIAIGIAQMAFDIGVAIGIWVAKKLLMIKEFIKGFIQKIKDKIGGAIETAVDFLKTIGKKIWAPIKEAFGWFKSMFKNAINAVISLINKVSPVNIPKLAKGGIVTSPTLAMIGEAGPEAVIPLNKMDSVDGTTNITINNPNFNSEQDMRKMVDMISRELQKKGNRSFSK